MDTTSRVRRCRRRLRTLVLLALPAIVVFFASWVILLPSANQYVAYYNRVNTTNAVVVATQVEYSDEESGGGIYYQLWVQFIDETTNKQITSSSQFLHTPTKIEVGSSIPIFYDPLNPSDAHVESGFRYSWWNSFDLPEMNAEFTFVGTIMIYFCFWANRKLARAGFATT
jgi:hypothetical protein